MGHFLLFPTPHGGTIVAFCMLLKLISRHGGGGGGSGFTLTGAQRRSAHHSRSAKWTAICMQITYYPSIRDPPPPPFQKNAVPIPETRFN